MTLNTAFLDFFKDLDHNNNRVWFEANKKHYETVVKAPLEDFVQKLLHELTPYDAAYATLPAKSCIYRIYRDVRFSSDKTPYKNHASFLLSSNGKKEFDATGSYIEIGYGRVFIASGLYMPTTAQLLQLRRYIVAHDDRFRQILAAPEFVACFGSLRGEQNKKLPAEFAQALTEQPLLLHKQFLAYAEMPSSVAISPDFGALILRHYAAALPLTDFLNDALHA